VTESLSCTVLVAQRFTYVQWSSADSPHRGDSSSFVQFNSYSVHLTFLSLTTRLIQKIV
jgi:hypothetical protein